MNLALSLFSMMLIPLVAAGLALIHQGLGRSRSAAHAMLASLCALAVSSIVFVLFGASWAGSAGAAIHSFAAGGVRWDWLGAAPFFARGLNFDGVDTAGLKRSLVLCLELMAVGLAASIPLSAGPTVGGWGRSAYPALFSAALSFPFRPLGVGRGMACSLAANFGIATSSTSAARVWFRWWAGWRRSRWRGSRGLGAASSPTTASRLRFPATTSCWYYLAACWRWWAGSGSMRRLRSCFTARGRNRLSAW